MGSFGRKLRREREMRGISLEEIARHTKISTRLLEAIENGRFDLLPGGIFTRSFVLHYARYLGLDEEQAGAEYDLAVGAPLPVDIEQVAAQRGQWSERTPPEEAVPVSPRRRVALTIGLAAVLVVLSGYALRDWWWPRLAGRHLAAKAPLLPPPPALARPAGLEPPAFSLQPQAVALELQIDTPLAASSVEVVADGKTVFRGAMRKGQTRRLRAASRIEVRAGDAGAVVLTLNGETQAPLGAPGEAKTVVFTREDVKQP
jgi:cytoskeleton protein RodZ